MRLSQLGNKRYRKRVIVAVIIVAIILWLMCAFQGCKGSICNHWVLYDFDFGPDTCCAVAGGSGDLSSGLSGAGYVAPGDSSIPAGDGGMGGGADGDADVTEMSICLEECQSRGYSFGVSRDSYACKSPPFSEIVALSGGDCCCGNFEDFDGYGIGEWPSNWCYDSDTDDLFSIVVPGFCVDSSGGGLWDTCDDSVFPEGLNEAICGMDGACQYISGSCLWLPMDEGGFCWVDYDGGACGMP